MDERFATVDAVGTAADIDADVRRPNGGVANAEGNCAAGVGEGLEERRGVRTTASRDTRDKASTQ